MKPFPRPHSFPGAPVWRTVLLSCLLPLWAGCHTIKVTEPKRSITEQFLLSSAAEHAIQQADLSALHGRKVYFEERYFKSYDKRYVLGAIREHLARNGALLVSTKEDAETIVEARSAGLGIETRESLVGIPALALPVPLAGTLQTPELSLYKSVKAESAARFALLSYDRASGSFVHSTGGISGAAHFHHYKLLGFFDWRDTDVPELDPKIRARMRKATK